MKKQICVIILAVLCGLNIVSTGQGIQHQLNPVFLQDDSVWQWACHAGGSEIDYGYGVAVDSSGSTYITGFFWENATFGPFELISNGDCDIYIAKLDAAGNWQWAQQAGGADYDESYDICIDSSGDILITGTFKGAVDFGGTTLSSVGDKDVFVAKLDAAGNWQWAVQAGGSISDLSYAICSDSTDNIYITGLFMQTANFGSNMLTSYGGADIFIAKLDSSGSWLWAQNAGSTSNDYGYGVAVDGNNNPYVTGYFYYDAYFGSTMLTSNGRADVFITKLDSSGSWLWAQKGGGTFTDISYDIAVDNQGNAYITGKFYEDAQFGSINLTGQGFYDAFIAKTDSSGTWQWVRHGGSNNSDIGSSIQLDSNGNQYILGQFTYNATFGPETFRSHGETDMFIAMITPSGGWQWVLQTGGQNEECGYGIAVDDQSNIYITGIFYQTTYFDNINLSSFGEYDVFIAKSTGINQPPDTPTITGPAEGTAGETYDYTFQTIDPDGDELYYFIDWDDGTNEEWIGPYTSGEEVIISHTWDEKGTYIIQAKAKDTNDLEGTWGQLVVTMPKSTPIIHVILDTILSAFVQKIFTVFTFLLENLYIQ